MLISTAPTSLPLLFFSYLNLALSSPPSFFLPQSLWQIWYELSSLSSCSIRPQWVPRYSFLLGNDAADELARRRALLVPSVIPCSLFSLISHIHSYLFSDWRHFVSSKFFDTQVSSFFIEELVLPRHACCVLSRLRSNGHSLLLSSFSLGLAESRILPAAPADTVPGHLLSHSALPSHGIFAALTLWRLSVSIQFLFQALDSCPASKAPKLLLGTKLSEGKVQQVVFSRAKLLVHLTRSLPHILHLRRNTIDILK